METVTITGRNGSVDAAETSANNDSIYIENSTITNAFTTDLGADTLVVSGSSLSSVASLGGGDDRFEASNSSLTGGVHLEDGDDILSVNSVTIGDRIDGGDGNNQFTLNNANSSSWINLATSPSSDVTLSMTDSTLSGVRATSDVTNTVSQSPISSYDIDASNSTITEGILLNSSLGGTMDFADVSIADNINGYGIVNSNTDNASRDTINIDSSTIEGVIDLGGGADSLRITNSTLTGSGNVINIRDTLDDATGETVVLENVNMSLGNVFLNGVHDVDLRIDNSTLQQVIAQPNPPFGGTVSINDSSLYNVDLQWATKPVSLEISNSYISGEGPGDTVKPIILTPAAVNDTIRISNTTIDMSHGDQNMIDAGGGDDLLEIKADTRFINTDNRDYIRGGVYDESSVASAVHDTLRLTDGPWTLELKPNISVTLQDNNGQTMTVNVLTDQNFDQVVGRPKDGPGATDYADYDGTLTLGVESNTIRVEDWEALESMPCYGRGTLILTAKGRIPVEDLRVGDLVRTADAGLQPVRWVGSRKLSILDILTSPHLIPIRVSKGALGAGLPERDLILSPQHRVIARGKVVERMFDADEVLVAAKHLTELPGVNLARDMQNVEYFHVMFDDHQIIFADGVASESLYSGAEALNSMNDAARAEIFEIFPELAEPVSAKPAKPARVLISGRATRKLVERVQQNGHDLCPAVTPDAYSEAGSDRIRAAA